MTRQHEAIPRGTRVTFTHYGATHAGRVIRDTGNGVVWVEDEQGGPLFRERWLHRESVKVAK